MRPALLALPLLLLLLPGFAPGRDAPPRIAIASIEQLPRPLPAPYDSSADADAQVAAALARAKARGKPLVIDLGANWCLDCRVLAGVIELPAAKPWIERNFEFVQVDVGRFDRNFQIPARYGLAKLQGVPALLVVDAKRNRLLNRGRELALVDARAMTPQGMIDWLGQWTK